MKTPFYISLLITVSIPSIVITDTVNPNYKNVKIQFKNSIKNNIENKILEINKKETLFIQLNKEKPVCELKIEKEKEEYFLSDEEISMIENNSEKLDKEIEYIDNLDIPDEVSFKIKDILTFADIPKLQFAKSKPQKFDEKKFKFTTYVSLAEISYKEGDLDESIKWYKKALKIKEDKFVINQLLSIYYLKKDAVSIEAILFDINDENLVYSFLTKLIQNKDYYMAKNILNQKINIDKKGYLYYAGGLIFEGLGNLKEAEIYYKTAYEKNKIDGYIGYGYARILEINKKPYDALKIYSQLESINLEKDLKAIVKSRINLLGASFVY